MREEFEIKILIYWLYKLCWSDSRLLARIIQSWGFSVCFILVLSQSFHSHYTERALIFCLRNSKWKLMKKFSLILHFWGIYGIFFHQTAIKSFSPQKEERLRFSSIVWENSLFTNIYMIKIGLLSPMLEIQMKSYVSANNESIVIYMHLIYLRWNILLSDIASE